MPSQLSGVFERMGLPILDESNAEAVLSIAGTPDDVLLFFAGDPSQRPEVGDVAVIFPELLGAFSGRLRGAVVARGAEKSLGRTYHVDVLPSLAVIRAGAAIGVIPRVRDWAEYLEKIEGFLNPEAREPAKCAEPRVEFSFSHKGARA